MILSVNSYYFLKQH